MLYINYEFNYTEVINTLNFTHDVSFLWFSPYIKTMHQDSSSSQFVLNVSVQVPEFYYLVYVIINLIKIGKTIS